MKRRVRAIVWWMPATRRKCIVFAVLMGVVLCGLLLPLPTIETWMALPLAGHVIVIDAGHGGVDGGAVSQGALQEKDVTLDVALTLRALLEQSGAFVYMTREHDTDLASADTSRWSRRKTEDLYARVALLRQRQPSLFISIHANAMPSPRWHGPQTFYTEKNAQNREFARLIQEELRTQVTDTPRQAKAIQGIYVLDHATMPAILVEVGFLSHAKEAEKLAQAPYRKQLAEAIYRGMLRYGAGETR